MSTDKIYIPDIADLAESDFFHRFTCDEIKLVLENLPSSIESYDQGEVIIMQGQKQKRIGIILEGLVSTTSLESEGGGTINEMCGKNELLGLVAATSSKQTSPFLMTALRESGILWFEMDAILMCDFLTRRVYQKIMHNLLRIDSDNNVRLLIKTEVLSQHTVSGRVLKFLTRMSEKRGTNIIEINMNQAEFARYLCVNRSKFNTTIQKLRKAGIIDYSKNTYTLLDYDENVHT